MLLVATMPLTAIELFFFGSGDLVGLDAPVLAVTVLSLVALIELRLVAAIVMAPPAPPVVALFPLVSVAEFS